MTANKRERDHTLTETESSAYRGKRQPSLNHIVLVTENPVPSAPVFSLAPELNRLGVETIDGNLVWSGRWRWLELALRHRVLAFVFYSRAESNYFLHQIFRARVLGCFVVRWWVGSDVMWCRASAQAVADARLLDQAVDLNIAVSPHLVDELSEIGITAEYVPSPCNLSNIRDEPPEVLPSGVLAYLPAERRAFYGEQVLIAAIEAYPELDFYIVNDDYHTLQHFPNVSSLGWVADMEPVWAKVGLLLRVTEHDGMPRMVLEALARNRYVIYSQAFEGCWYGRSVEQVLDHLERFRQLHEPNHAGARIAQSISQNAGNLFLEKITEARQRTSKLDSLRKQLNSVRHCL